MRVGVEAFLILGAALFSLGMYGAVSKKGAVQVLMSLELMALAVNINVIALSRFVTPRSMDGWFFAVFAMVVSAAEVGLGLALVLAIYRRSRQSELTGLSELKG
jgi:NAD(P)H-quinone oxidoreductase subunit 4L